MTELIQMQPDDASYDEIMQELAFERMIMRGLEDVRQGRVLSSEEMQQSMSTWWK